MAKGKSKLAGNRVGSVSDIKELISQRGKKQEEVDQVLNVSRRMVNLFGDDAIVTELQTAKIGGRTMAYWDTNGNLAVNQKYMNTKKMNDAMDRAEKSGFHPSRGNKTGLEATVAHEMGHHLSSRVGAKIGKPDVESASREIVERARAKTGHKTNMSFAKSISGYATHNFAECVAEATGDWYCNGSKAKKESRAIVAVMNKVLKG